MRKITDSDVLIGQRLKLRDLQVLLTVAQSRSMAGAASYLGLSQPAVTKIIGNLEAAVGARLFDRSPRGVEITAFGQALLKCREAVFDELRQGLRNIAFLADPSSGELSIGCLASITAVLLPGIIRRFTRDYPQVVLTIDDLSSLPTQIIGLRTRQHDLAFTRLVKPLTREDADLHVEHLFDDRLIIVAGGQTKWARRRRIDLAELVDEPWIMAPKHTWNYSSLAGAFAARGLETPPAKIVTLSMPLRSELLTHGPYVTAFAISALRSNRSRRKLKVLPVDLPQPTGRVAMLRLRERSLSPVAERFASLVRELAASDTGLLTPVEFDANCGSEAQVPTNASRR
jgi:DNA-binding transcriptional LysR family regulator